MSYNKETGMYEGFIYKIYNDVNDKVYIGQTSCYVEKRWDEHLKRAKWSEKYHQSIHKAIRKYGVEHFNIECIDILYGETKQQLNLLLDEQEVYWIDFYNSYLKGYNETKGGKNNPACALPEKPVLEYNLECLKTNEYPSITEASKLTGFSRGDIGSCCRKDLNIYIVHNKIYRFADDALTEEEIKFYLEKYPKIYQYDFYGNLLNVFEFIQDAVNYLISNGINAENGNIGKCCNGGCLSASGYVWRKHPDTFETYRTPQIKRKIEKRNLETGELICVYNSFVDIEEEHQYTFNQVGHVRACCNGYKHSAYGFFWCYEGDFDPSKLTYKNKHKLKAS